MSILQDLDNQATTVVYPTKFLLTKARKGPGDADAVGNGSSEADMRLKKRIGWLNDVQSGCCLRDWKRRQLWLPWW
jgi:hypothetical protein